MPIASNLNLALVVRHFPGQGRLSGLVSFSREIASALDEKTSLKIFSGDQLGEDEVHSRQAVRWPFWIRVWLKVKSSGASNVVVLSGIHSPRWAIPQALGIRLLGVSKEKCLFIQAVGLDSPWSKIEMSVLASVAKVSALNPKDFERLKKSVTGSVQLSPGISLGRGSAMRRPSRSGVIRVGFFGHLNEVKGADRLPQIFESLSPGLIQPVIAGVGKFEGLIRDWATQSRHSVEIHGYLDHPVEVLKSIDILVAPFRKSATVLGLSQVVLEAVAMGIPVVGTPIDAICGVVRHQVEGLIADSDSEISLALQRLSESHEEIRSFSDAAIERGGQFSIENVANQMLNALGVKIES